MTLLLVDNGSSITVYRKAGGGIVNHIPEEGVESSFTVLGDLLPLGEDRQVVLPTGFRREGARELHLFVGQTELRPIGSIGDEWADEIEVTIGGVASRLSCIAKTDHENDTAVSLRVDHIRYLFALPGKDTAEVGTIS